MPPLEFEKSAKKRTESKNGQSITVSLSGIKILTMAMSCAGLGSYLAKISSKYKW